MTSSTIYQMSRAEVLHYDSKGNAVVQSDEVPPLGKQVTDKSGNRVGKVFDIIGNVNEPYIVVKTEKKALKEIYWR